MKCVDLLSIDRALWSVQLDWLYMCHVAMVIWDWPCLCCFRMHPGITASLQRRHPYRSAATTAPTRRTRAVRQGPRMTCRPRDQAVSAPLYTVHLYFGCMDLEKTFLNRRQQMHIVGDFRGPILHPLDDFVW